MQVNVFSKWVILSSSFPLSVPLPLYKLFPLCSTLFNRLPGRWCKNRLFLLNISVHVVKIISDRVCLFVFIYCCFLNNVNCVVSKGVRINQNIFLFCFSFPLGNQCSAVVLLKFLCAQGEVCIIPGDDVWKGKTVESFRSAEFEKLWNSLLFQMCTTLLKYIIERLIMKPQEGMFSHSVEQNSIKHSLNKQVWLTVKSTPHLPWSPWFEIFRNINMYVF